MAHTSTHIVHALLDSSPFIQASNIVGAASLERTGPARDIERLYREVPLLLCHISSAARLFMWTHRACARCAGALLCHRRGQRGDYG